MVYLLTIRHQHKTPLSLTHEINTGRTIVRSHMWLLLIAFLHQVIRGCCSPVWTLISHSPDHTHMWLRLTVVVLQLRKCLSPAWTLILPIRVHNHMWLHLTVVVLQIRKCILPAWTLILHIGVHSHMWLHLLVGVVLPHTCLCPAWMLIPPGGALFQVRTRSLVLAPLMGP